MLVLWGSIDHLQDMQKSHFNFLLFGLRYAHLNSDLSEGREVDYKNPYIHKFLCLQKFNVDFAVEACIQFSRACIIFWNLIHS